ncbi:iron chaperone [Mucilaginibacter ginsenosidivorans]|uniref:YdhG-like domain-containing protein n=1 Tax=Mucilaginibacter ginsenosidivorans TaxID=398053 RepID=A0A5B8V294_9SPHI|nr:DUF1801 domain-containing protein [Mucilaginibacter ginsenosidivorans]QEC64801.1 hypothetical protein FRZ54_20270 [Mucilaginibacter ginsenosidivorans]
MTSSQIKFETVDQYIASFPADVQQKLETIRTAFKQAVPGAAELIHYQMPALDYNGKLVYFAAFKNHYHITLPHAGKVLEAFKDELSGVDISKSTIRLPAGRPLPMDLLTRMVKFKAEQLRGK